MLAQFDPLVEAADGCHWEIRTRWLPGLTAGDGHDGAAHRRLTTVLTCRCGRVVYALGVQSRHLLERVKDESLWV
jgi:hypothetical protein